MNSAIWIVDDDQSIRFVLERTLTKNGFETRSFSNGTEVVGALREDEPQVILSDVRMPGHDGFDLLSHTRENYPNLPVVIMTAYSDLESTVSSFSAGAFEYMAKPFDIDDVVKTVERAIEFRQNSASARQDDTTFTQPERIVGQAPAMQEAYRAIARLSQSNATVLITGESGTGKELVADALHKHSARKDEAFVALNMAALPQDLIEAELFGHERGAFTGANTSRAGRFEQANGGTLFLDEIGDMPVSAQTRLLRVLAENSFYRVGGRQIVHVNVRIIAATHQDLEDLVARGAFREDLYHRLNVIRIHVPPLRDRTSDIDALAQRFLADAAKELEVPAKTLAAATLGKLQSLAWPGNVRQLENVCHWLTVMAPGSEILVSDLPSELQSPPTDKEASVDWQTALYDWSRTQLVNGQVPLLQEARPQFEKSLIKAALEVARGRKLEAAKLLGWGRNTLTRKMSDYDMD